MEIAGDVDKTEPRARSRTRSWSSRRGLRGPRWRSAAPDGVPTSRVRRGSIQCAGADHGGVPDHRGGENHDRSQELDRHRLVQLEVRRLHDDAHATVAGHALDAIPPRQDGATLDAATCGHGGLTADPRRGRTQPVARGSGRVADRVMCRRPAGRNAMRIQALSCSSRAKGRSPAALPRPRICSRRAVSARRFSVLAGPRGASPRQRRGSRRYVRC